jgi:hypothetical protein
MVEANILGTHLKTKHARINEGGNNKQCTKKAHLASLLDPSRALFEPTIGTDTLITP